MMGSPVLLTMRQSYRRPDDQMSHFTFRNRVEPAVTNWPDDWRTGHHPRQRAMHNHKKYRHDQRDAGADSIVMILS